MSEPTRSISDIAEELMHEFEAVIAVSAVTEVVIRLSRNGGVSLSALADMAREELSGLVSSVVAGAGDLPDAVAPQMAEG